jgi:hypothetical protein
MTTVTPAGIDALLRGTFAAEHVRAALEHFQNMVEAFQRSDWEPSIAKGGKFIEAVLKALSVHVGNGLPPARQFKAGSIIKQLGQLPVGSYDDAIRLTIPRACEFAYDIASNRGARHDPGEVDPNEMDAGVVVATCSWIIAEMLRYSQKGAVNDATVKLLVGGLTQRKYPFIEEVDGRAYFHLPNPSARDVALLTLWYCHPGRMDSEALITAVMRHGFTRNNAVVALSRLRRRVDEDATGEMRLLQPGLREAEDLLQRANPRPARRRRRR